MILYRGFCLNILIGLCGAKGSGKTTAFNAIKKVNNEISEITLANKLKNVCSEVFEIPRNHFDSHKYKEKELNNKIALDRDSVIRIFNAYELHVPDEIVDSHIGKILTTPRHIAQYVGTEVLRSIYNHIHCDVAIKNVKSDIAIVTDLRFPDEIVFFKAHAPNFIPIYIKNVYAESLAGNDQHESERHLYKLAQECPYVLVNDCPSKELFEKKSAFFILDLINKNKNAAGKIHV